LRKVTGDALLDQHVHWAVVKEADGTVVELVDPLGDSLRLVALALHLAHFFVHRREGGFARDAFVRPKPGQDWRELSPNQLPKPEWFAIETIVHDLELIGHDWRQNTVGGTFINPKSPWERP
jgi:hypothetical protein